MLPQWANENQIYKNEREKKERKIKFIKITLPNVKFKIELSKK